MKQPLAFAPDVLRCWGGCRHAGIEAAFSYPACRRLPACQSHLVCATHVGAAGGRRGSGGKSGGGWCCRKSGRKRRRWVGGCVASSLPSSRLRRTPWCSKHGRAPPGDCAPCAPPARRPLSCVLAGGLWPGGGAHPIPSVSAHKQGQPHPSLLHHHQAAMNPLLGVVVALPRGSLPRSFSCCPDATRSDPQ